VYAYTTTSGVEQELAKSCGLLEGDCSGYVASDFVLNILGTRAFLPHNSDLGIEVYQLVILCTYTYSAWQASVIFYVYVV
jgi:hypothetical protein